MKTPPTGESLKMTSLQDNSNFIVIQCDDTEYESLKCNLFVELDPNDHLGRPLQNSHLDTSILCMRDDR